MYLPKVAPSNSTLTNAQSFESGPESAKMHSWQITQMTLIHLLSLVGLADP